MPNTSKIKSFGFTPRCLKREKVAYYLDCSPNHVTKLVNEGKLPKPKDNAGVLVWFIEDLDDYLDALKEGEETRGGNTCDALFEKQA